MLTLAFLQNQWFKNPAAAKRRMQQLNVFEDRMMWLFWTGSMLFSGCRTSQVLVNVFGPEECGRIIWDESSQHVGGFSASAAPADPEHIYKSINFVQPSIVLVFGKIALDGVRKAMLRPDWVPTRILVGPHPTSRGADTFPRLRAMRKEHERWSKLLRSSPPLSSGSTLTAETVLQYYFSASSAPSGRKDA